VLSGVLKHVDERMAHFARRREVVPVVAIAPDLARSSQDPVHRAGQPDRQALCAAGRGLALFRPDEQVEVVPLD
jgi:hypothetical protein